MPVLVHGETLAVADAGTTAPVVLSQTDSLAAVVADEDVAVINAETNTPLALGKPDLAVVTSETTVVL